MMQVVPMGFSSSKSRPAPGRGSRPHRHASLAYGLGRHGLVLALILMCCLFLSQAMAGAAAGVGPAEMPPDIASPKNALSQGPSLPAGAAVAIVLDASDDPMIGQRAMAAANPGPWQIGFERSIPALSDPKALSKRQVWQLTKQGGPAYAFAITSPGAKAVRLGIWVLAMPDRARLRFYSPSDNKIIEIAGSEVNANLRRNLKAGETGMEAETFWSPLIAGETLTLEVELPPEVDPKSLVIALPRISHIFELPYGTQADDPVTGDVKAAAYCHKDVMCYPDWDLQSRATARMLYTSGGKSYLCSGTLLNDLDPTTYTPYFLTAHHCISTQSAASSLETFWFWRSTYCDSGVPGSFQALSGGADLLYAAAKTDTSFLLLSQAPPPAAIFSGWQSILPAQGRALTGIHHPAGDLQKFSLGNLGGYWRCVAGTDGKFSCSSAVAKDADHFSVTWQSGITEGGSSGSGIFLNDDQLLVGTLHGGSSTCSDPTAADLYGRFDIPYQEALHQWLSKITEYVLSVGIAGKGMGSVVSDPAGIYCGSECTHGYPVGTSVTLNASPVSGSLFAGWSGDCTGTAACTLVMNSALNVTANFDFVSFADVPATSWAANYITAIHDDGLTQGCGNSNYCPKDPVTREQMAAFLVRAIEGDPAANYCGGNPPFNDVSPGAWSCGHIKRLVELKITLGCGGGNYCPYRQVTREQMAVFIVRALEGDPAENYCGGVAPFVDVSPSSWSCGHIKRLVELGITQGFPGNEYRPNADVNREQMAAFLARAFLDMD